MPLMCVLTFQIGVTCDLCVLWSAYLLMYCTKLCENFGLLIMFGGLNYPIVFLFQYIILHSSFFLVSTYLTQPDSLHIFLVKIASNLEINIKQLLCICFFFQSKNRMSLFVYAQVHVDVFQECFKIMLYNIYRCSVQCILKHKSLFISCTLFFTSIFS